MSKIFKFKNDVDTDQILASQYLLLPNTSLTRAITSDAVPPVSRRRGY